MMGVHTYTAFNEYPPDKLKNIWIKKGHIDLLCDFTTLF